MSKIIFIINVCTVFLFAGQLKAQDWYFLEQEEGVCSVDSLIVTNPLYYSLLDSIEYHWSKCEFDKNPSIARVNFLDTNHLLVTVMQVADISPLVRCCYMNKIYGVICYKSHQYFFCATREWMIDKKALQKSASAYTSPYFSAQVYRDVTTNNNFLMRKIKHESEPSYLVNPFEEEWNEEVYDKLRFEIFLSEDGFIYKELEGCVHSNSNPN